MDGTAGLLPCLHVSLLNMLVMCLHLSFDLKKCNELHERAKVTENIETISVAVHRAIHEYRLEVYREDFQ